MSSIGRQSNEQKSSLPLAPTSLLLACFTMSVHPSLWPPLPFLGVCERTLDLFIWIRKRVFFLEKSRACHRLDLGRDRLPRRHILAGIGCERLGVLLQWGSCWDRIDNRAAVLAGTLHTSCPPLSARMHTHMHAHTLSAHTLSEASKRRSCALWIGERGGGRTSDPHWEEKADGSFREGSNCELSFVQVQLN